MLSVKMELERSIQIEAPVESCFALVQDFKAWPTWSPWLILDPGALVQIYGDRAQVGHKQTWEGTDIGSGEIELVEVQKNKKLSYKLSFLKPWRSTSQTSFEFVAKGNTTEITWSMRGSLPFFMFFWRDMMIGMVGSDFLRGLKILKDHCEAKGQLTRIEYKGPAQKPAFHFMGIERSCLITDIAQYAPGDFQEAGKRLKALGVEALTQKMLCPDFNFSTGFCRYLAGFEVQNAWPAPAPEGMMTVSVPSITTLDVLHKGPYRHISNAWSMAMNKQRMKKFKVLKGMAPFETYLSFPGQVPEAEITTLVSVPIRV